MYILCTIITNILVKFCFCNEWTLETEEQNANVFSEDQ